MTSADDPVPHGDDWLDEATAVANVPTLACMLVQLTGDLNWIRGRFVPTRTRGLEDNDDGGLPPGVQAEIREAAARELRKWFRGAEPVLPSPPGELLREMMSVTLGEDIAPDYIPMIRHELGLADEQTNDGAPTCSAPPDFTALIIGAGISGLCAAIKLAEAGIPYVIVERSGELGGVWFENRYPGAACDVPSHLYSFSFAPYRWSRFFAGSREIHDYLAEVADRFDIRSRIRFGLEVVEARWDEKDQSWEADVRRTDGSTETLRASMIISGVGAFNKPRMPDVPGIADFKGVSVHTARYPDAGLDLQDKAVVLVGNGASAMQVAPAIADQVASLTVIQRTPQWVAPFPKFGQSIPAPLQRLLDTVPLYRRWYRLRLSWAFNDKLYDALTRDPQWESDGKSINKINDGHRRGLTAYMQAELGEAQHLLPKVLPSYPPFGKRMLLDNGWFRTLARPNVTHVTASVVRATKTGVVTDDGVEHPADVVIWATGFDVVNLLAPMRVRGVGGLELHAEWDGDDARAYLGTVVPGFPNFFCLYGPNTQFGHGGSLISVLERQMHYVMSLLRQMFAREVRTVEVRRDVYEAYNQAVDDAHARLVWSAPGVDGYYRNSKGRIVVNNPFRILEVWQRTETADLDDYRLAQRDGNAPAPLESPAA